MSEYVYDKNKPGQSAGAGDDTVSGNAGSGMTSSGRPAAPQSRSSGSESAWENDDWSMRSSSVSDDDDPLIKLARLMEQNERNFEAAAQRSDDGGSGRTSGTYSPEVAPADQVQQPQAYQAEPHMADPNRAPEPVYHHAPEETDYVPANDFSGQGDSRYAGSGAAVAEAPASRRSLPPVFEDQADDQQYDPFAPGGSAQPLPERDFDVSRIPRAIRPAVSVEQSQRGGLHGSASQDQTDADHAQEPPAVVARQPQPTAPRPPAAPMKDPVAEQPDPIAAELQRYVDANELAQSKRANAASQVQTAAAVQPASELAAAPASQPDFSYLREVEDLRVPPRQPANEQPAEPDVSAQDTAQHMHPASQTEDADVLYDGYEDDENGGLFASRGMMVAAGVMAFVLLGGGALLAYQAIFSSDDGGPPPLVLADKNPVRMLPDGQAADTSGSGDIPLTNEGDFSNGVMQPGAETPIARINPNIDPDRTVRQIGADGNGSQSEGIAPRSVRTFKVNPDGSIVAEPANTVDNNSNAIQPRTVTTQQVSGNGQFAPANTAQSEGGAPLPRARPGSATSAPANSSDATGIQPRVVANNTTSATGRADLPVAPRVSVGNNAPSFNQNAPSVQPSANTATASAPAATVAPAAPAAQQSVQPAAPAAAVGDFVVQVSSQRSEEAARSAFVGLQRRFPLVLGNQSPDIARADLGSRGVFYRVRVGPMETRVAAANFCESLKNAGGDCIVARR